MKRMSVLLAWALASVSAAKGGILNVAPNGTAYSNGDLWPGGAWNISQLIDSVRGGFIHGDKTPSQRYYRLRK